MGRVKVVDTLETAKKIRETFHASPAKKQVELDFAWPDRMLEFAIAEAEIYHSDKWNTIDDYKHVAEAAQFAHICPGTTIQQDNGRNYKFDGEWVELPDAMPKHIAVLAKSMGFMVQLPSGRYFQIDIPHAYWGAGRFPKSGRAFLVLYSKAGPHFIVTGEKLDISEDGIIY